MSLDEVTMGWMKTQIKDLHLGGIFHPLLLKDEKSKRHEQGNKK